MTAQDLKNSILQLAVQGKLVPQDPSDEPASELLKQCAAKSFQENDEDALPFDIPSSWEWTKLGDLVSVIGGTSYKSNEISKTGVRILRGGNIQKSEVIYFDNDVFLPVSFLDVEKTIKNGDVLIVASTGSKAVIGKPGFVFEDDENTQIGAFLRIVRPKYLSLAPYIRTIFDSEYYRSHIRNQVQGMNINNVKNEHITEFIVPIPPLAEQARIVAKIEELLPLIESYGDTEEHLKKLNAEFPDKLRKSILQQAVQGKLTERDPADEPASELLKRIRAEKAKLIAEGKIKKEKPSPPITDEEKPFDIPDTWEWVRLGELGETQTGTTPSTKNPAFFGNDIPFIKPADIYADHINYENEGLSFAGSEQGRIISKNSIMMVCIGGSIGKTYYNDRSVCCNQQINTITPIFCSVKYVWLAMSSNYFRCELQKEATGTATPIINKSLWSNIVIPLPPLAEQERIVARVEELLAVCDGLK